MDSNTSNTDNKQYCKGCEKILSFSLFITNGKPYRTCNICRFQNNAQKSTCKQKLNGFNTEITDQMPIEYDDFGDFMSGIFDAFEDTANSEKESENKENEINPKFKFSCMVNIIALKVMIKNELIIL